MRVLQLRQNFHRHMIAIELREVLRRLTLLEGVGRVVDELRLNAEARRLVAVNGESQRRGAVLPIGCDIAQFGKRQSAVNAVGLDLNSLALLGRPTDRVDQGARRRDQRGFPSGTADRRRCAHR